ncbi:MAG: hypothetical protein AAB906_01330 [Patescibacteria group bacterium]
MSKKKTRKFKKNKPQLSSQPERMETTDFTSSDPVMAEDSISGKQISAEKTHSQNTDESYSHSKHVKKDVRKIVFIIFLLSLIFIVIYFLGSKTNVLSSFGDWIYKIANIQTL